MQSSLILTVLLVCGFIFVNEIHAENQKRHTDNFDVRQEEVEDAEFWKQTAKDALAKKLGQNIPFEAEAKNIIFYLGDGMSVGTLTAARILKGQKVDNLPFGEEAELYLESFPFTGVSKTFCSDAQVADSACTATAYLCGTKANIGTIGVTPDVLRGSCPGQADSINHVSSVLAWAQEAGKSTGLVSRSKVTDASPAGTYAHSAERNWENDAEVRKSGGDPNACEDIAKQLVTRHPGINMNVILGGGRRQFIRNTTADPEQPSEMGYREDDLDLIEAWKDSRNQSTHAYVTGKEELLRINTTETDYLLGLFSPGDMAYLNEQERANDPSLEDMTRIAVEILSKNPNGFFLFVEGSNIDSAHHANLVQRALWETIELDKAIQMGDLMTEDNETLIVVTSDHAHVLSISADAPRGNPILGIAQIADDGLPYGTLSYANGPGPAMWQNGQRVNITGQDFDNIDYKPPSPFRRDSESHGGEDVLIMAKGPYAHLLTGYQQQSNIPHFIGYAACIGEGPHHCKR